MASIVEGRKGYDHSMRMSEGKPIRLLRPAGGVFGIVAIILLSFTSSEALTRWSSVMLVPDADLLEGGTFVLDAHAYYFSDIIDGAAVKPVGLVKFGVIEWVNIETGYAGGFTLGLKSRILGETKPWMPSLALGVRNVFSHHEAWLFDREIDELGSEAYFAVGKSIEPARLRFHAGIQSIPGNRQEQINPFFAIEKYFGKGLYVTAEVHRRDRLFHPSLFAAWRFWRRRLEVSIGVVDITGMFMSEDVPPNSPFFSSSDSRFVRPGVWVGLRFRGGLRMGKTDGLTGLESSLSRQASSIAGLRAELDSLKALMRGSASRIDSIDRSIARIADSSLTDEKRLKALAVDRLALLRSLYNEEPFEPEAVNKIMTELVASRDRILPVLYEIISDPVMENRIRTLAVTALGEIGTQAAADIVIEVLGQSPGAEITIECLIALGKMKETRAVYLIQQLSNDPNDDVAFTATEVLHKLEKETGVTVTPVSPVKTLPATVPEKRIGSGEMYVPENKPAPLQPSAPKSMKSSKKEMQTRSSDSSLQRVEKPDFLEATVTNETTKEAAKAEPLPPQGAHKQHSSSGTPVDHGTVAADRPEEAEKSTEPAKINAAPQQPAEPPVNTAGDKQPLQEPMQKKTGDKKSAFRKRIDTSKETW